MKKAFTLLELIFVLVVIAIITTTLLPRIQKDKVQEAALQIQTHIRYTQHLAMVADQYNPKDDNWYKKRWQIIFSKQSNSDGEWAYTIFSDFAGSSSGRPNEEEIALNPLDHNQRMTGGYNTGSAALNIRSDSFKGMRQLNLGKTYNISSMEFSCSQRVSFDYLGRPIKSNLASNSSPYDSNDLIEEDCNITLSDGKHEKTVQIHAETGFVEIF